MTAIVQSLLDTDFYKLLMLQLIWREHGELPVRFDLINRTTTVRLVDEIAEADLRGALDAARDLRLSAAERRWLEQLRQADGRPLFAADFLDWLGGLRLCDYVLTRQDGQWALAFEAGWAEATLWEIPALAIVSELRARAAMAGLDAMGRAELYACAQARLLRKLERLKRLEGLSVSEFGTRRRHGFDWQRKVTASLAEALGPGFIGTSNVLIAMKDGYAAVGTNGHELPMAYAAMARTDAELSAAPYHVLADWAALYGDPFRIVLPDAFGTAAFLRDAPDWVADWSGFRPDSTPPIPGGERIIAWWDERGVDPKSRRLIFSDALDVETIERTFAYFKGRVQVSFGWGTNLTNDFHGCHPSAGGGFEPISLVCKMTKAGGRSAVKLSDNPEKASGDPAEVARYLALFGGEGRRPLAVRV